MKTNFIKLVIPLFISVLFLSCSTEIEPVDPALLIPIIPIDNPVNNNQGGANSNSTGNYWPMSVNNQWTYKENGVLKPPMKITTTQQINGVTYYKYTDFIGTSTNGSNAQTTVWTRRNNGNYYVRQEATIPAQGGNPAIFVSPIEIIILKDYIVANTTWTQNLVQTTTIQGAPPIETNVTINGKILEKDIDFTVNSIAYTNVIKVQVIQTTQGVTNLNYYWFARNIGMIKYQNIINSTTVTSELQTYVVN